jgi:hypothetical protein
MRFSLLLIPILLLTGPAAALDLQAPSDAAGVPLPVGQNSFSGAPILSDSEIAALIPSPYPAFGNPGTPPIMEIAKLAVGAVA